MSWFFSTKNMYPVSGLADPNLLAENYSLPKAGQFSANCRVKHAFYDNL